METWAWLAAYVLGFALLQLYLYRYFIKGQSTADSSPESTTPNAEGGTAIETDDRAQRPGQTTEDLLACGQCGGYNENDSVFTYCKYCGEQLG